jgi:predicted RNA-binding protein with RPS1 domain
MEGIDEATGLLLLSKRRAERMRGWERIVKHHAEGDLIKGKVTRKIKGGLLIDVGGVPVFLPASQIDIRRVPDVGVYLERDLECKIIKIDRERMNIVVSRRKLMEERRNAMRDDLLATLQEGQIRKGVVKNIADFGAFLDIGGVDGLLHITDMSWGRVNHPSEIVQLEQELEVKVLRFDRERNRIALGLKQLEASPWAEVEKKYPIGSKIKGEVVNIMPYGAFVKLEDGIEGLVHISEMSWTRRISHPSDLGADRRPGRRRRARHQPGEAGDLAGHEADRDQPLDRGRGPLPGRHDHRGRGAQPDQLRRLHRDRGGHRRPAPRLRHELDQEGHAPRPSSSRRATSCARSCSRSTPRSAASRWA